MEFEEATQSMSCRQSSVTYIYQAMLIGFPRNIVVTWTRASTIHSLTITMENLNNDDHQTCQIDFQSSQFWSRKGLKSLQVDNQRVDIFWDFRAVKFFTNPEPCSDYYVAIVYDRQIVQILGDFKAEALKRTKAKLSPLVPKLLHKEEVLYGTNCFYTKKLLENGSNEHNIVIQYRLPRAGGPELRISIDGRVVVRVMNLNWRFRENETVLVNNVPVQVFWDVHDWLFSSSGSGHGLFLFKQGLLKNILAEDDHDTDNDYPQCGCCNLIFAIKVDEGDIAGHLARGITV